jgi:hypothetical protein
MWQGGSGGSIPSMAAFIVGVLGIFRLTRTALRRGDETDGLAKVGAWAAAIVYIANPNLIYMQATAMGESIFLAFFIWAVAFFAEFARGNNRSLLKCGWCLAAACLTRYDGWFLTALVVLAALAMGMRKREANIASPINAEAAKVSDVPLRGSTVKFVLMAMAAPVLWLGYNILFSESSRTECDKFHVAGAGVAGTGRVGKPGDTIQTSRARSAATVVPAPVLRTQHSLRQRTDFRTYVVAVLHLQRSLWFGITSGLCGVHASRRLFSGAVCMQTFLS